ncbi:hypothetical protein CAPTEDRAFT_211143 [Capitella teleta]|uniref:Large ribosomal subunit protein mL44 dsRNA binding domain-containing protein n=1 Tax=Capitella teleta TaxID=283909 RepID=R7UXZ1_CAPTE|nr:hypothetical protein CAPTEDRAFT_211143 [Capitella teleta]|eukprot:ELU08296.1 hypothetical protein CAPTEDRAFT_211143 [Capitella teleta]
MGVSCVQRKSFVREDCSLERASCLHVRCILKLILNVLIKEMYKKLLWEAGSDTVVSSYMVGFYDNKKLIGKGFGESVPIAEEMAARDALRNVFGLKLNRPALPFGKEGRNLNLDLTKLNASMAQISSSPQQQLN